MLNEIHRRSGTNENIVKQRLKRNERKLFVNDGNNKRDIK